MGETVKLWCNTTESSGVVWTWKTTLENITYVSVNGSITGRSRPLLEFSVVNTSEGECSLMIRNIHSTDSGLYDCETNGTFASRSLHMPWQFWCWSNVAELGTTIPRNNRLLRMQKDTRRDHTDEARCRPMCRPKCNAHTCHMNGVQHQTKRHSFVDDVPMCLTHTTTLLPYRGN